MSQPKKKKPEDRFFVPPTPDRVYRLKTPDGVIVAVGTQAYCRRVQARRPGTRIEVF